VVREAALAHWTRAPRNPRGPLAGLARAGSAGRVALARAHPSPRRQVPGGGKGGHVGADAGEDDLRGAVVDPGIAVGSSTWPTNGGQRGLDPFIHGGDVGLLGFDEVRHPLNRNRGARGIGPT